LKLNGLHGVIYQKTLLLAGFGGTSSSLKMEAMFLRNVG
jgi:hypothetical protein